MKPPLPSNDDAENSDFTNRNPEEEVTLRESAGKPCGTTKVTAVTVGEEGSAEVEELTEEDRQYLDAERAGIQMEEAPEPAENPTLVVLSEGVV